MRSLIVPCAGSRLIDEKPIFLNKHPDGEMLAIKAILGVQPESYDRIIYTVLKDIDEQYVVSEAINKSNNGRFPIEVISLESRTRGPADTIYQTIERAHITGEFAVRDSHAYISIPKKQEGNFIAGLDLTQYERSIDNLREKSFIVQNEQGHILDVVEKHFCSDVISVGLYGFKRVEDYMMAYEHLNDHNYPIDKLYVSHVISYLIGYKQRVFHSIQVSEFEDWSTQASWYRVQRSHSTCFLDLDNMCGCAYPMKEQLISRLKLLSSSGVYFVPFTSKVDDGGIGDYLDEQGIRVANVVCGCRLSRVKTIASSMLDLKEMMLDL